MAVRSAISVGFPSPNYVAELGQRDSILPGEFIVESGQAIVTVLTGQVDDLTLSATAQVVDAVALNATIGPITLAGEGMLVPLATGDPAVPSWWHQYVQRHEAERAARRETLAIVGEGYGVLPVPIGTGQAWHDVDGADAETISAAVML
jgi:hypothetical protein